MACIAATQPSSSRTPFRAAAGLRRGRLAVAVRAAASEPQQPAALDRRHAMLGLAAALVAAKAAPAMADGGGPKQAGACSLNACAGSRASFTPCYGCCARSPDRCSLAAPAETEIFYGLATPPTSYGGYGGVSANRKDDGGEHGLCQCSAHAQRMLGLPPQPCSASQARQEVVKLRQAGGPATPNLRLQNASQCCCGSHPRSPFPGSNICRLLRCPLGQTTVCSQVYFRAPRGLEERNHQQARQGNAGRGLPGAPCGAPPPAHRASPPSPNPSPRGRRPVPQPLSSVHMRACQPTTAAFVVASPPAPPPC